MLDVVLSAVALVSIGGALYVGLAALLGEIPKRRLSLGSLMLEIAALGLALGLAVRPPPPSRHVVWMASLAWLYVLPIVLAARYAPAPWDRHFARAWAVILPLGVLTVWFVSGIIWT